MTLKLFSLRLTLLLATLLVYQTRHRKLLFGMNEYVCGSVSILWGKRQNDAHLCGCLTAELLFNRVVNIPYIVCNCGGDVKKRRAELHRRKQIEEVTSGTGTATKFLLNHSSSALEEGFVFTFAECTPDKEIVKIPFQKCCLRSIRRGGANQQRRL